MSTEQLRTNPKKHLQAAANAEKNIESLGFSLKDNADLAAAFEKLRAQKREKEQRLTAEREEREARKGNPQKLSSLIDPRLEHIYRKKERVAEPQEEPSRQKEGVLKEWHPVVPIPQGLGTMGMVMSDHPLLANHPDRVPDDTCPYCGKIWPRQVILMGDVMQWCPFPTPCDCESAVTGRMEQEAQKQRAEEEEKRIQREKRLRSRVRKSGLKLRYQECTFEKYQVDDDNREAYTAAKNFSINFRNLLPKSGYRKKNGLLFTGDVGTGKTHLSAAISMELLKRGIMVVHMTMIDLLAQIKKTFNDKQCGDQYTEQEILEYYKTVPLLVIDDIGKEPATSWSAATIYNIVNGRYEERMPIIVTSNYTEQDLIERLSTKDNRTTAAATIDRIGEMCKKVTVKGKSRRAGI